MKMIYLFIAVLEVFSRKTVQKNNLPLHKNLNGQNAKLFPLIESNTARGRIIIDRDPNSNEGCISPEGVRITATNESGETFSTLTVSNGSFVLNLPEAPMYKVTIVNVFGEQFMLERGEYEVRFSSRKMVDVEFVFRERRRQIQFRYTRRIIFPILFRSPHEPFI